MLYALNTRAELCETGDDASWVNLGRQWSTGEILLETNNHVGHDVGFLSMPFRRILFVSMLSATCIIRVPLIF